MNIHINVVPFFAYISIAILMWFQFFECISVCGVGMGAVCLLFACIGVHQNECGEADTGCLLQSQSLSFLYVKSGSLP